MTEATPAPDWRKAAAVEYGEKRADLIKQREKAERAIERMQNRLREIDGNIEDLDRGAKAFGLVAAVEPKPTSLTFVAEHIDAIGKAVGGAMQAAARGMQDGGGRQFKDVALDLLAEVYPRPLKAAEVQEHAEAALGRSFHWKTAGMTLYRLSKEYKARREGQKWFFVPEGDREALSRADILSGARDLTEEELERQAAFDATLSVVEDAVMMDEEAEREAERRAAALKEFFE